MKILDEVKRKFTARDFGFHSAFQNFEDFSIDSSGQNLFLINDKKSSMKDGFDCQEIALTVYDTFTSYGYETEIRVGPDAFGFWDFHVYARVHVENQWITVDFTPPYYQYYPFNQADAMMEHPHEASVRLEPQQIQNLRSTTQTLLRAGYLLTYRYFDREGMIYLIKVGSCDQSDPYSAFGLLSYKGLHVSSPEKMPTYCFSSSVEEIELPLSSDEDGKKEIVSKEIIEINMDDFSKAFDRFNPKSENIQGSDWQWSVYQYLGSPSFRSLVKNESFASANSDIEIASRDGVIRYGMYVLLSATYWYGKILETGK
ncbi:MAG: hypothetical protein KDD52_09420 [Bdellovibrionales bacterium]|nr:hypothetical protein [Bdellovibrionales bacterium]